MKIIDKKFIELKTFFGGNEIHQSLQELNSKFKMKQRFKKNQKVGRDDKNELVVKNYPNHKSQPSTQQPKIKLSNCPSCKRNRWL